VVGVAADVGEVAETVEVVAVLTVVDGASAVLEPHETSTQRAAVERDVAREKRRM